MAVRRSKHLALTLALVAGTFLLAATACYVDRASLSSKCGRYITAFGPKVPPSAGCCQVVRKTDIGCACSTLAGNIRGKVDMDKACYVAAYCHNPMKPGSVCGSYKVPARCI